jgi:hypothetical protein
VDPVSSLMDVPVWCTVDPVRSLIDVASPVHDSIVSSLMVETSSSLPPPAVSRLVHRLTRAGSN